VLRPQGEPGPGVARLVVFVCVRQRVAPPCGAMTSLRSSIAACQSRGRWGKGQSELIHPSPDRWGGKSCSAAGYMCLRDWRREQERERHGRGACPVWYLLVPSGCFLLSASQSSSFQCSSSLSFALRFCMII
jgi:hypothetical protein